MYLLGISGVSNSRIFQPSDTIFYGSIIWLGLGEREYPEEIQEASFFDDNESISDAPPIDDIQEITPIPDPTMIGEINIDAIWSNISGLEAVIYYLENGASVAILSLSSKSRSR